MQLVTEEISQVNFIIFGDQIFGISYVSAGHQDFLLGFYVQFPRLFEILEEKTH